MADKRIRTNTIALAIIKTLAFSTLFILVFLIGYLTFKGLVKDAITISPYKESKDQVVSVFSGDSHIKRMSWEQVRDILDGKIYSMRSVSGYDDDIQLFVDRSSLPVIAEYFALSEASIAETAKVVEFGDKGIARANGSLFIAKTSQGKASGLSRVELSATVVAVNKTVTTLVNNKKVGIVDALDIDRLENGSIMNWSDLNGSDLRVVRCTSFEQLFQTEGGYFVTEANLAYSHSDVELLSIRSTHMEKNLTLRFMASSAIQGGKYGGIGSIIVNTFFMILLSILFAAPVGLGAAIYLSLYAHKGKLLFIIQSGIDLLASVPSIIFGLFGLLVFVQTFGWSFSLISGSLTIALMICPTIIRTSQEAIKSVDASLFDGSIALGATKIETILKISIPNAREGIIGGIILAIGRAAGETAALLYTIGSGTEVANGLFSPARSLAMHIYLTVSEGRGLDGAFAASLVLMVIVLITNRIARLFSRKELR
ncbi:phosphate ABC transporter, permease protein PstA [Sphaerochaeta pleomorpha str. Grapes]|uniref:Phosphate transport system permease protein PstA n=1 Tax=Sphaerochaeta pleomorpha (strain ATCC BAA-1885 / DSM 22778 / Grapes) TaxID=158190 RepID=G8QT38_SPHPG|nr:phosphate ABC transporter permease PstA [Sphaerochaeta pleomorpha]AEV27943.1 phosphate ABC transporter, permease protein PstA [Sphaerochaeta pleomorpha str. Grapes]